MSKPQLCTVTTYNENGEEIECALYSSLETAKEAAADKWSEANPDATLPRIAYLPIIHQWIYAVDGCCNTYIDSWEDGITQEEFNKIEG
jgi:hypothetical protein